MIYAQYKLKHTINDCLHAVDNMLHATITLTIDNTDNTNIHPAPKENNPEAPAV
jgi:hypothetical protein